MSLLRWFWWSAGTQGDSSTTIADAYMASDAYILVPAVGRFASVAASGARAINVPTVGRFIKVTR